jgi:hypothetical protein
VLAAFPKTAGGRPAEATLAEQTVLSEVLALRTILINITRNPEVSVGSGPFRRRVRGG